MPGSLVQHTGEARRVDRERALTVVVDEAALLELVQKKFTRERIVPIISAWVALAHESSSVAVHGAPPASGGQAQELQKFVREDESRDDCDHDQDTRHDIEQGFGVHHEEGRTRYLSLKCGTD
jgi:hypothetical protein